MALYRIFREDICLSSLFMIEEGKTSENCIMWNRISPIFLSWNEASDWLHQLKDGKVRTIKSFKQI